MGRTVPMSSAAHWATTLSFALDDRACCMFPCSRRLGAVAESSASCSFVLPLIALRLGLSLTSQNFSLAAKLRA